MQHQSWRCVFSHGLPGHGCRHIVASLPLSWETTRRVVASVIRTTWEWNGRIRPMAKGHPHSALLVGKRWLAQQRKSLLSAKKLEKSHWERSRVTSVDRLKALDWILSQAGRSVSESIIRFECGPISRSQQSKSKLARHVSVKSNLWTHLHVIKFDDLFEGHIPCFNLNQ